MSDCRKCVDCDWCAEHEDCGLFKPKPKQTNADMLRAKSDEGLEEWYWWMHKEMMNYTDSHVFVHEWLKQDATE